MSVQKMEILAPAGDEQMLRAAVYSGADCVYLGVEGFNARAGAANFNQEALQKAVSFCHARNCRVLAAINTVVLPGEEDSLEKAVAAAVQAGCDGIIAQDLCTARTVQKIAPGIELHASTQMSVHSVAGVQQLAKLGFSRAVLARELSLQEIEEIAKSSPIELEVFVHGALCVCVSGQCYMSAFLGGRSANRGQCAGACRLPFSAQTDAKNQVQEGEKAGEDTHHLSLKDLSILKLLPRLYAMGVVSAKIEGRLRGPEYCAIVVDAAQKALQGQPYDERLLEDVFSRSGFTDGWVTGRGGKEMFGVRTQQNSVAAKTALPKARELYRREMPRVPVKINLMLSAKGAELEVYDGINTVNQSLREELRPAQNDIDVALQTALQKMGGTPFYAEEVTVKTNGLFLAGSQASALRRTALEDLLLKREAPPVMVRQTASLYMQESDSHANVRAAVNTPMVRGRFEHVSQVTPQIAESLDELVLPLFEAEQVPPQWRAKTRLWLPRMLFGAAEQQVAKAVQTTQDMGFCGYEAGNIGHFDLLQGQHFAAGFGLNITNAESAMAYGRMGAELVSLSPELNLAQMRQILRAGDGLPPAESIVYGHLPLMISRACPLHNVVECAKCSRKGELLDRKGKLFPVTCGNGVRTIYNPVALWMADRLEEIPTPIKTLWFTLETPQQVQAVVADYLAYKPSAIEFTRGLYDKGLTAK